MVVNLKLRHLRVGPRVPSEIASWASVRPIPTPTIDRMRSLGWFTPEERIAIDRSLSEMRKLKRTTPLGKTTVDAITGYEMSVAAELRLRIARDLAAQNPLYYGNLKDPKTFFRLATLDTVSPQLTLPLECILMTCIAPQGLLRREAA